VEVEAEAEAEVAAADKSGIIDAHNLA